MTTKRPARADQPLSERLLAEAGAAFEEIPGSAKDWEDYSRSAIGRWWRRLLADSQREVSRQLIYAPPEGIARLQGIGEVLDHLLGYLDSIPQDKVESEQDGHNSEEQTDGPSDTFSDDF